MKKPLLLFAIITLFALNACKKDDSSIKDQYTKLIVGTWKSTQLNTKVYDLSSNELLKDSTTTYEGEFSARSFNEVYDINNNTFSVTYSRKIGASVATADTTSYATYTILGNNLTLKQRIGGTQTKPILVLNTTAMCLQYTFTGMLNPTWGLEAGVTYKITQSTNYKKL
ncbi:lipocalin family protein [Mucilaginibacter antarcticus]|uniref:Lipocalin family protein n=1 Tax=Mucilaginibacter antarcticus TaxID=1855725 RepID=A0ABW5XR40_9SPHI